MTQIHKKKRNNEERTIVDNFIIEKLKQGWMEKQIRNFYDIKHWEVSKVIHEHVLEIVPEDELDDILKEFENSTYISLIQKKFNRSYQLLYAIYSRAYGEDALRTYFKKSGEKATKEIKKLKAKGYSQKRIAEITGISAPTICSLIRPKNSHLPYGMTIKKKEHNEREIMALYDSRKRGNDYWTIENIAKKKDMSIEAVRRIVEKYEL